MQTSQLQHIVGFAVEIVARIRPVVEKCDRSLGDQLRRSLNGVVLNTAEAAGSDAGNRRARLATGRGSVYETRAAIQLAVAWGYTTRENAQSIDRDLDRLAAHPYGFSRALHTIRGGPRGPPRSVSQQSS